MMQPIVAVPSGEGFEIVAGERRWRAAQEVGIQEVPVLVRTLGAQEIAELALIENIQREELNPMERAQGLCDACRIFWHDPRADRRSGGSEPIDDFQPPPTDGFGWTNPNVASSRTVGHGAWPGVVGGDQHHSSSAARRKMCTRGGGRSAGWSLWCIPDGT